MSRVICLLLVLLLSGCATIIEEHHRTVLMDRKTGDTKDCTVDMLRTQIAYDRYKTCIKDWEEQGYTVWGQF